MLLGFDWLAKHNPEINWQTKEVKMSRCPEGCRTCQDEMRRERTIARVATTRIRAVRMGGFPVLVEETPDEDNYVPEGVNMPEGGVNSNPDDLPGLCAVDDKDMDDPEIEDEDRI